ncbi:MAG: NTP transferase domain-containing protein [Planctomycetes bacterium]|nr:NTP transferase domain-containing protein [Planctomycetota bacterium]
MKYLLLIPVGLKSKRLHGKALLEIKGRPLFTYTYESAVKSKLAEKVLITTDEPEVITQCEKYKLPFFQNELPHLNGTSRCAEAASKLNADFVINHQVDYPMLDGSVHDKLFELLHENELVSAFYTTNADEAQNPNRVKIASTIDSKTLYFSRSVIPHGATQFHIHVGVYGYTKKMLKLYTSLKQSSNESFESLEQLRFLENCHTFKLIEVQKTVSIDAKEDFEGLKKQIMR